MDDPVAWKVARDQDDLGKLRLRPGTFKVFANRKSSALQASLQPYRRILDSSVSERRKDPNFVKTFASGVLLVKPAGRRHQLNLTYVGFGWYKLKTQPTLSVARKLAGWSKTSPSTVFSLWGSSFNELTQLYSDQILWLLNSWGSADEVCTGKVSPTTNKVSGVRAPFTTSKQSLLSRPSKLNLDKAFSNMDPTLRVGHRRSSARSDFATWSLRRSSGILRNPPLRFEHLPDAEQTKFAGNSNKYWRYRGN